MNEFEFLQFLDSHEFTYERIVHPAVFTCTEAELHRPKQPTISTKNLFLCDKKARRFFLVVTACEKTMNLQNLAEQINVPKLRFSSEENLNRLLQVQPGSVTMMALINDSDHQVELWIDEEIWHGEVFQSHPLVNTATLLLSKSTLERFFETTGHTIHFIKSVTV